jgi:NAD(P)-dependent dehydrogenase (short-subunit alcohol dehydrogenase family)
MNDFRKNAIVTGATGAIGTAIARQLAVKGFDVTIIARNEQKALKTVNEIQTSSKNPNVGFLLADLSVKSSIQQLANNWERPLHVLINNTAVTPRTREETNEGIELQWATNVLGYFWMINCFTSFLKMAAPARVVNVASYWAGDLDISDLECKRRRYDNDMIYRQSKQANRMLTIVFAEKLKPLGITVNAVHPGDVNSTLSNNVGYGGFQTPDQGADTPVWAATQPELTDITGKYFERREETTCQFASNKPLAYKLFEICERY